jgi:hypothetical protein
MAAASRPGRLALFWATVCMYHDHADPCAHTARLINLSRKNCQPLTVENGVMLNADVCTEGAYGES